MVNTEQLTTPAIALVGCKKYLKEESAVVKLRVLTNVLVTAVSPPDGWLCLLLLAAAPSTTQHRLSAVTYNHPPEWGPGDLLYTAAATQPVHASVETETSKSSVDNIATSHINNHAGGFAFLLVQELLLLSVFPRCGNLVSDHAL